MAEERSRTHRRFRRIAAAGGVLIALAAASFGVLYWAMERTIAGLAPLDPAVIIRPSVTVVDRNDRLLRAYTTDDDRWRLPVSMAEVDPRYLRMLLAYEDGRFWRHHGVDPLAIARSGLLLLRHGRLVSGASTLTMQVARLLERRHEKTFSGKWRQMARAITLERQFTKRQILDLYLMLAPFGGNVEGIRAAALGYLGHEPKRLSIGEAALLVALPQSPEMRRPDRRSRAARRARDRVLDRVARAGIISRAEAARAKRELVPDRRLAFPLLAPHLSDQVKAEQPVLPAHRLTIDRELQTMLEPLVREHARLAGSQMSAAMIVVAHQTGEILAHVGSPGYLDEARFGGVDMVSAVRSPGSTLKPLIYGLGFETGVIHPETLIEDTPARFGSYTPKNFDKDYHGTVTIREALAQSLNIPAVKVLEAVGPQRLISRMTKAGASPMLPEGAEPTLAIALGGVGLRLSDLASLYAGIARGGERIDLTHRRDAVRDLRPNAKSGQLARVLSPVAAWYVADILKDAPPPPFARGGRIAYKTGTSYGFRDAWAVGFDGRHTIAAWVGRPDGTATPGLMGRTAAAPLLFDAFQRLSEKPEPLSTAPPGALRATGSSLPPPLQRFRERGEPPANGPYLDSRIQIAFPLDRAEFALEDNQGDPIVLRAEGGALPLTWLVDGKPLPAPPHRRDVQWQPGGPGFVKISVIDSRGRVDRISLRLR